MQKREDYRNLDKSRGIERVIHQSVFVEKVQVMRTSVMQKEQILELCCTAQGLQLTIKYCTISTFLRVGLMLSVLTNKNQKSQNPKGHANGDNVPGTLLKHKNTKRRRIILCLTTSLNPSSFFLPIPSQCKVQFSQISPSFYTVSKQSSAPGHDS